MRILMFVLPIVFCTAVGAATPQEALLNNIKQARQSLETTENRITKERIALGEKLRKLEQEVIELRNETAVARRKMDERTLSLTQLEERLASWTEQQDYQRNLLDRYLQQSGYAYSTLEAKSLSEKIALVGDTAAAAQQTLSPQWQTQKLVLPDGAVIQANTLSVGPVTWFIQPEREIGGLASHQNGLLTATSLFDGSAYEQLNTLQHSPAGVLTLDPTLGRAVTKDNASESIIEHVVKGGIWVVPIVLFAFIATAIGLYKVTQLWRLPKQVAITSMKQVRARLKEHGEAAFKGMQQQLLKITLTAPTTRERDDELFMQLQLDKSKLDKWINTVAVTAAVAPLLGLLGTVSGMIETFRMMTAFGSSDPEVISGGIAKALVTTELGLVVAIPALILNAVLSRKAKAYYDGLESFALLLSSEQSDASNDDNAQPVSAKAVGGE